MVVKQMSPLLKDMVTANIYDLLGRESEKYMPFCEYGKMMVAFKTNPFAQQKTFYDAYLIRHSPKTWLITTVLILKNLHFNRPIKINGCRQ